MRVCLSGPHARWNENLGRCIYRNFGDIRTASVDLVVSLNYDAERRFIIGELFTQLDLIHVETKQALYAEAITTGSASHLPRVGWGGLGGPDTERELPVR